VGSGGEPLFKVHAETLKGGFSEPLLDDAKGQRLEWLTKARHTQCVYGLLMRLDLPPPLPSAAPMHSVPAASAFASASTSAFASASVAAPARSAGATAAAVGAVRLELGCGCSGVGTGCSCSGHSHR
jgi:hypothetical protein